MRTLLFAAAAAAAMIAAPALAGGAKALRCAPEATAVADAIAAVRAMFDALGTGELDPFNRIVTPDFYAFDVGEHFTAQTLVAIVRKGMDGGRRWTWTVTEPRATAGCDMAWVTWINRGQVEDASGRTPRTWLESANLRWEGGRWRVQFLHSTRVAEPKP